MEIGNFHSYPRRIFRNHLVDIFQTAPHMLHVGLDYQTYCLLFAVGTMLWWPLGTAIGARYGYQYVLPISLLCLSLPYFPIPQALHESLVRHMKHEISVVYLEPPAPIGTKTPEVILLIPHGFMCIEGLTLYAQWIKDKGVASTIFVDKLLQFIVPGTYAVLNTLALDMEITGHVNIDDHMRRQQTVAAFPGGFVEAVGYTEDEQILYLGTISYWLKQCKRHRYALRIFHIYNGSDSVSQASVGLQLRAQLAGKKHFPVPIPTSINKVSTLVARCLFYDRHVLPESTTHVAAEIARFITLDKQDPRFPSPHKTYTLLTARL